MRAGSATAGAKRQEVMAAQVRAYTRTRNGRTEQVGSYTQTRQAAQAEGESVVAQSAVDTPERPTGLPPIAGPSRDRVVVVFISGAADRMDARAVANYTQTFPTTEWRSYRDFAWDEASQAEAFIRSQPEGTRIRLVGHSYGGDTAAQIAARLGAAGHPLDMLVTVDPVGRGTSSGFFERVRQGTRRWINVNATGGSSFQRSNIWAGLGGSWNYAPMGHADDFINAPVPHIEFAEMMDRSLANGRSIRLEVLAR